MRLWAVLIVIVDADSWWLPDTLVRLVHHMLLNGKSVCSVTEDLEITLEMPKKGASVGYVNVAARATSYVYPFS
jgi:hypothetical protein